MADELKTLIEEAGMEIADDLPIHIHAQQCAQCCAIAAGT